MTSLWYANGVGSGHARVFGYSPLTDEWSQVGLDIDGDSAGDSSGHSLSLSDTGGAVAVGAISNDDSGLSAGHVKIYRSPSSQGGSWNQMGMDLDGESAGDGSGHSVSLSSDGQTVAIGAPANSNLISGVESGHVRVYEWDSTAGPSFWVPKGQELDGAAAFDASGQSVWLSGDATTVAIGAPYNGPEDTGHVRVYRYNTTTWTLVGMPIVGTVPYDRLGNSVSMTHDGEKVAVGATGYDANGNYSGQVRVFVLNSNVWEQQGTDILGEAAYDYSGYSVALSGDTGDTVAIGAIGNDGNGSEAGHVRVYKYIGSDWEQQGMDLDGEAVADESGWSVSLSDDGMTVAIGASSNDGNGDSSGHVRVFKFI